MKVKTTRIYRRAHRDGAFYSANGSMTSDCEWTDPDGEKRSGTHLGYVLKGKSVLYHIILAEVRKHGEPEVLILPT